MTIGDFLNQLDGVKSQKGGWIACCPAHDDKKPSLSISEGNDGRILLTCHAGCPTDAIVDALGMKLSDLFVESKTNSNGRVIEATYGYRDETGKLLSKTFASERQYSIHTRQGWMEIRRP
jgi:hypothetical protein